MKRRLARLLAIGCVCSSLPGCEFDKTTIPVGESEIVVQSVIDPGAAPEVLVERTLSGSVTVKRTRDFDANDPINSTGGVPVSGASVTITGGGQTWTGSELHYPGRAASYGAGRYLMSNAPGTGDLAVRLGARYTLTVKTADGALVTGSTVVPVARQSADQTVFFDRDRDTLHIAWQPGFGARIYGLRIDSPFTPFEAFTDSTRYNIPGTLQNIFSSSFRPVFLSGAEQVVTVYAADTNYFDYYRSVNDPFTGSGIINKLTGGLGLFGSIVVVKTYTLEVLGESREPVLGQGTLRARYGKPRTRFAP